MNKKILWIFVFIIFALATVKGAIAAEILGSNFEKDLVSFIDTETDERTDINVGNGPNKVAVSWDHRLAAVTNTLDDTVSVISLEKKAVLTDVEVGKEPIGIAITYDSKYAIVANSKSKSISILDLVTLEVITEIEVGDQPIGVAVTSDNKKAYITTLGDNKITVIDLESLKIIASFSNSEILRSPAEIKITPNDKLAYIFDTRNDYLVTVDLEKEEILDNNIKTQNININNELILGNQLAIFSASDGENGIIQIIDFDDNYAKVLSEAKDSIYGIDFFNGELFIANDNEIREINTKTGVHETIVLDGKITDVEIIGKTRERYKEPKEGLSRDAIKIIVIVVVILIILILIFWRKPEGRPASNGKAAVKKSKKTKKKIKKKIKKRQKKGKRKRKK